MDASFPLAALQGDVQGIIALYYSRPPGRPDMADYSAQLLEVIYELLGKAVEIQILDDTN